MMLVVKCDEIMTSQFISDRRKSLACQLVAIVRLYFGASGSDFVKMKHSHIHVMPR